MTRAYSVGYITVESSPEID